MIQPIPGTSTSRRIKSLIISWELFRGLLTEGVHPAKSYAVIDGAIPDKAALLNVRHAWPNCIELLLQSDEFEEVPEGAAIPHIKPVMQLREVKP